MEFVFLQDNCNEEAQHIRGKLDNMGRPPVVFPQDLFDDIRSPIALHATMKKLGYLPIQPPHGSRWRWYGNGSEFAARWAYVDENLTSNPARISAELDQLGRGKVGPRVGPFSRKSAP